MFPAHVPGLLWDEDASLLEQHIISIAAAAPSPTASSHPPPSTGVPTLCSLRARLLHTHPPEPACRRETRGARVLGCLFVRRRPATHAPCPCPAFFRSSLPRRCLPPRRSQTGGPTDSPRQPKSPGCRSPQNPASTPAAQRPTTGRTAGAGRSRSATTRPPPPPRPTDTAQRATPTDGRGPPSRCLLARCRRRR